MDKTNKLIEYTDKLTNLIDTFNDMKYENNDLIKEYTNDKKILKTYILKLNNLLNKNNIQDNNLININTIDKLTEWCKIMIEDNCVFILVDRVNNSYKIYSIKDGLNYQKEIPIFANFENIRFSLLYDMFKKFVNHEHINTLYKIYENNDYKFFVSKLNGCNYNQRKDILNSIKEYIINNKFIYPNI